ncbi:MAG TPA: biotin/lipoyl-containing protein [Gemmatimonadales bacterium]
MKYFVSLAGRTHEVLVESGGVVLNGRVHQAQLELVPGTPLCHLILDGRSFCFAVSPEAPGEWNLLDAGETVAVEVLDERTRYIRSLAGGGKTHLTGGAVKAPMPGLVVKLLVGPGDQVKAGQSLVVLEAMKMENELKAPGAGLVAAVSVKPGQAVEKGQPLVLLQPVPPA